MTQKRLFIAFFVAISIGLFYWFQFRPYYARVGCHNSSVKNAQSYYIATIEARSIKEKDYNIFRPYTAVEKQVDLDKARNEGTYNKDKYEDYYKTCIRSKGL